MTIDISLPVVSREAQKELEVPSTSSAPLPPGSPQMPELQPMEVDRPVTPALSEPEEKVPNPFELLVKAAKMQNPKQFDIPEEMMVFAPLPGRFCVI